MPKKCHEMHIADYDTLLVDYDTIQESMIYASFVRYSLGVMLYLRANSL